MLCAACGSPNQTRARFCIHCGTPLVRPLGKCIECGVESTPGAKFCRACGTSLGEAVAAPGAAAMPIERAPRPTLGERFVTVVVDPRTKRRTFAVAGVLLAITALLLGFFGGSRFPLLVGLALLPLAVWVPIALWLDRHEPEPRWLVFVSFLWGASIAVVVAYVLNTAGSKIVGIGFGDEAGAVYGRSVSAPIVEELAKGAVLLFIFFRRRQALSGILDALVYATMVGLGFAMTENVLYFAKQADFQGVIEVFVLRGVLTPLLHPFFTSLTAAGLVLALRSRDRRVQIGAPLVGLALAMGLHSFWNSTGSLGGLAGFAVGMLVYLAIFISFAVVAVASMRQEARIISTYLPEEVISRDQAARLFSIRGRSADIWTAFRTGGWRAVRARDDYLRALSASAFRSYREARSASHLARDSNTTVAEYRESLGRLLSWDALTNVRNDPSLLEGGSRAAAEQPTP
jgi:RsiW-degrading membrane proteinase PrsW (M82 family)